jgi:hypothetical protein
MSKEGILSILTKKIERSDSTLPHSSFVIRLFRVSFMIRLVAFQASGDADMKLHEIQDHFHEVPHAISEYRRQMKEIR